MKLQMSDTAGLGIILSLSGGFMDAYSYLLRDHVFANAQTGNVLLLGIYLSQGSFAMAFRYFLPVLFFLLGIIVTETAREHCVKMHWRQLVVLVEAVSLTAVAFMPLTWNMYANAIISFSCGIQVEAFRKIRGNAIATTMCIGNLRSGTQKLYQFIRTGDKLQCRSMLLYFGIILCFVCGAVIGRICIELWGIKAICVSSGLLILAFLVMLIDNEKASPIYTYLYKKPKGESNNG